VRGVVACHVRPADKPAGPRPSGGHTRGGGAVWLVYLLWWTRCPRKGSTSTVGRSNVPDKVAAVMAHPSSGSTCGGGAEAAW
jgi:hypothetical protein